MHHWVLTVKASSVGHGACTGGWAQALGCLQSHQGEVGGRRAGMVSPVVVCPGLLSKRKWNHTEGLFPCRAPRPDCRSVPRAPGAAS